MHKKKYFKTLIVVLIVFVIAMYLQHPRFPEKTVKYFLKLHPTSDRVKKLNFYVYLHATAYITDNLPCTSVHLRPGQHWPVHPVAQHVYCGPHCTVGRIGSCREDWGRTMAVVGGVTGRRRRRQVVRLTLSLVMFTLVMSACLYSQLYTEVCRADAR